MSERDSFNAFSEGIELGGLRSFFQIKILIVFLLNQLDDAPTLSRLTDSLVIHGLANYFDTTQAIDALIEDENIRLDGDGEEKKLYLTEKGKSAIAELEKEIPLSVRERAYEDAVLLQAMERRKSENTIEVERFDKGFNVTLTVRNKNDVLMKLTVYAADEYQVEKIRDNFLKDAVRIYSEIVSSLFL